MAILSLLALAAMLRTGAASTWTYPSSTWTAATYPFCHMTYQSPIDLVSTSSISTNLKVFSFTDYSTSLSGLSVLNDGHSAKVSMSSVVPTMSGGGLETGYSLAQFHFHWGNTSTRGSEHTFGGVQAPLELHLVHYRTNDGSASASISANVSNSLAVLGVMFEIQSSDNAAYAPLIAAINKKPAKDASATIDTAFKISDLMPSSMTSFYRYSGSLTTPECNEIVQWTVFTTKVGISESQMTAFRGLTTEAADNGNTYRAIQATNGRPVYLVSAVDSLTTSGVAAVAPLAILPVLCALLARL